MITTTAYFGDCLKVMKDLSNNSIDAFICDLPYGCLAIRSKMLPSPANHLRAECPPTERKACDWDIKINLPAFWEQVKRLSKNDNTPVVMFCSTKFGYELIKSNESWFRYDLVWDKIRGVSFLHANKMPMRSHEMIYIFSKKGATYERVDISGNYKKVNRGDSGTSKVYNIIVKHTTNDNTNKRCALSIIKAATQAGKGKHPTEKSVALYKWLIERYTKPGDTILDPTAGSFNSCIAANELGRSAIGIEMNKNYYDIGCVKMGLE